MIWLLHYMSDNVSVTYVTSVPWAGTRHNSMVHDVSHGYKTKHLSIHAWKAARSVSARSWARPSGAFILLHAHRTASERNWARQSIQGNTVHANFVMSGSCSRNRGYVRNRDVPCRSSLRHNSMGPYTFPRDNTVAANHTHQLYWSLCPHKGSYGSWRWTY